MPKNGMWTLERLGVNVVATKPIVDKTNQGYLPALLVGEASTYWWKLVIGNWSWLRNVEALQLWATVVGIIRLATFAHLSSYPLVVEILSFVICNKRWVLPPFQNKSYVLENPWA